jgi:nucleoside-diphosphate-sugar epimerase
MKTILLTGASGFVGMQIFKTLSRSNVRIAPVVRTGKESIFQNYDSVDKIVRSPDIFKESTDWWTEQCTGVDAVIHAAWYAEPGKYLQSTKNIDCLIGSLNLAKGATRAGVKRFVGIGTCLEYDLSVGLLTKDTQLNPMSPYAGAKAALYMVLSQFLPEQSVDFTWCRLFYLYGEGEDERRLIPYIHNQLSLGKTAELSSGDQIRDFLNVEDAGQIISDISLSNIKGPVNVCSGVPISVRQLAENIADKYGRRDLLKFRSRQENRLFPDSIVGVI